MTDVDATFDQLLDAGPRANEVLAKAFEFATITERAKFLHALWQSNGIAALRAVSCL